LFIGPWWSAVSPLASGLFPQTAPSKVVGYQLLWLRLSQLVNFVLNLLFYLRQVRLFVLPLSRRSVSGRDEIIYILLIATVFALPLGREVCQS